MQHVISSRRKSRLLLTMTAAVILEAALMVSKAQAASTVATIPDTTQGKVSTELEGPNQAPSDGTIAKERRAGFPTDRDKWRYCPIDGSHPCVDLDIPGVTTPETTTSQ